jgi:lipopolysaccharide export LptBFGC system permease protein LptF
MIARDDLDLPISSLGSMSWTLFKYILKDLLRVFLLTSGALSAIMSFGGLLRPLYEHGLSAAQALKILSYFSPAMTTYSLPIAALFATTIVYGRLSADNEITAARAAGISHGALALPAVVLGLCGAILSVILLSFVVPVFTLKVERVIYSNIAKLVADQIERTHQIKFDHAGTPVTVFAQHAEALPPDPNAPRDQVVRLIGPMIVTYEHRADKSLPPVPDSFYMAGEAHAVIRQSDDEESDVTLSAALDRGTRFPRTFTGPRRQNTQVSVRTTRFGPIPIPSPVRENTKFMDLFRLQRLLTEPEGSRRVRSTLRDFIRRDQEAAFLGRIRDALNSPEGRYEFDAGGEQYVLLRGADPALVRKGRLVLTAGEGELPRVQQMRGGRIVLTVAAREVLVRATPDPEEKRVDVVLEMIDCLAGAEGQMERHENFSRPLVVGMPTQVQTIETRTAWDYTQGPHAVPEQQMRLRRDLYRLYNSIITELNARASFAVSCLILVMVGCALGMMFRSGNFLSAFAVSVIPALLSIALIVAGQHTGENIPWSLPPGWVNPLPLGLALIWSGNAVVLVIATVLLVRLQRQ